MKLEVGGTAVDSGSFVRGSANKRQIRQHKDNGEDDATETLAPHARFETGEDRMEATVVGGPHE